MKPKANKFNKVENVKKRNTNGSKAYRERRKADRLHFNFDKINLNAKTIQDLTNRFIVAHVVYADQSPSGDLNDLDYLSGPDRTILRARSCDDIETICVRTPLCSESSHLTGWAHDNKWEDIQPYISVQLGGKEGVGQPAAIGLGGVL